MKNKIWILHENPNVNATLLDDESLGDMITACAQVLCNVHFLAIRMKGGVSWAFGRMKNDAPLPPKHDHDEWSLWGKNCLANYNALLEYAQACCGEYWERFCCEICNGAGVSSSSSPCFLCKGKDSKAHKHEAIISWCEINQPDLPDGEINEECKNKGMQDSCDYNPCDIHAWGTPTHWPLVMPDEHRIFNIDSVYKVRNNCLDLESRIDAKLVINLVESYRHYYCACLLKIARKKCKTCRGAPIVKAASLDATLGDSYAICAHCNQTGYILQAPVWTRREQPDWLDL